MGLTLWWGWKRLLWTTAPLPRALFERDRVVADRAALTLDRHLAAIPPTTAFVLAPYRPASQGPRYDAATPEATEILGKAIKRTELVLRAHSLPGHLINALLRDRDPATIAQSRAVTAQIDKEKTEERRLRAAATMPPAMR